MAGLLPLPKQQFFDNNGNPLVGGKVYTYAAGTTNLLTTYTSASGVTANPNPVILDARGEASIWLSNVTYKITLTDYNDVPLYTVDNVAANDTTAIFNSIASLTAADVAINQELDALAQSLNTGLPILTLSTVFETFNFTQPGVTSPVFTAPSNGIYLFSALVYVSNTSSDLYTVVYQKNETSDLSVLYGTGAGAFASQVTFFENLLQNDRVRFRVNSLAFGSSGSIFKFKAIRIG